MFKKYAVLLVTLFLLGCATGEPQIGSDGWHDTRIEEIEAAYEAGDIDKEKYLELKNEADSINANYSRSDTHRHGHVGYGHRRGTSIGIGVGF